MDTALGDIRILDISRGITGQEAVTLLSDMGAEVIRVSLVNRRDDMGLADKERERQMRWLWTRNRKEITLDLNQEKGRQIFLEMVKKSNVVIQNFALDTAEKMGFDYEAMRQAKPDIIYCALSGFGQTGPYRNKRAYDITIQSMSGIYSMTGYADRPPVMVGIQVCLIHGYMMLVMATGLINHYTQIQPLDMVILWHLSGAIKKCCCLADIII